METGRISEGCAGWSPGLSSSSAKGKSGEVLSGNHIAHRGPDNHPWGLWEALFPLIFPTTYGLATDISDGPGSGPLKSPRPPQRSRGAEHLLGLLARRGQTSTQT